jgi:hypothetical protein
MNNFSSYEKKKMCCRKYTEGGSRSKWLFISKNNLYIYSDGSSINFLKINNYA